MLPNLGRIQNLPLLVRFLPLVIFKGHPLTSSWLLQAFRRILSMRGCRNRSLSERCLPAFVLGILPTATRASPPTGHFGSATAALMLFNLRIVSSCCVRVGMLVIAAAL